MCKHTGEKPFKCDTDGCGKTYTTAANLRAHQKRHGIKAVVGMIVFCSNMYVVTRPAKSSVIQMITLRLLGYNLLSFIPCSNSSAVCKILSKSGFVRCTNLQENSVVNFVFFCA